MPVYVQWKWVERTKSFLVIFHFYDDRSKTNLRTIKKMVCIDSSTKKQELEWLTWAPSHVEVGLLSEVLRYANIIDGIDESKKRELRPHLEIVRGEEDEYKLWTAAFLLPENKRELLYFSEEEPYHCAELCPEYIEYLKNILKSSLK